MFRFFQRVKKRTDKSKEGATPDVGSQRPAERRSTVQVQTTRSPVAKSPSPSSSPSPSPTPSPKPRSDYKRVHQKRQQGLSLHTVFYYLREHTLENGFVLFFAGSNEETKEGGEEEEQEAPSNVELSTSERKRRAIRKKYGINKKDEEFFQRKSVDAEAEEFENVNAKFRPAATKMRKAKLRWKNPEKAKSHSSSDSATKTEPSFSSADTSAGGEETILEKEGSEELDSTQLSNEEVKPPTSKSIEKLANLQGKPQERIEKLLREIHALLSRVGQLEDAHRKSVSVIKKLRARLHRREKKISDLSKRIKHLERHCDTTKVAKKTVEEEKSESEDRRGTLSADEDKPSPEQEAVALRGLAIMKRNQILEQIVKPAEARILANFFEAENARPNETIVMLIDRAFGYGIEVLLMRPDLFEDVVDNELRLFLLDSSKAKRVLLDCILLHPEYVPIAWGGNILTKRQRERQLQRQGDTRKAAESKDHVENEKGRDSAVTSTTKMLFDFLSNTFGEGAKDKSKDASPVKSASSSSEESPVKRTHNGKPKVDKSISEKRQEPFPKTPDKSSVEKSEAETEQSSRPAWTDDRGERTKRKVYRSKVPQKRFYDRRRRK
ncbi:unnamed protein product [Haemonchus placei]|uniref:DNA topoisomerase (ATP-hydrolyzing) n=1 Tax=Haemonchus placei TaxID=6290 RepID=A0A0N4X358_HAEPC|nr:unnamed protein product [Haemonchus placei]